MSIWGKLGGAAAGFLVSGPIGAIAGAAVGHVLFDREADAGVAFTMAIIALGAKMAKADGIVTDDEVEAFERIFTVPPGEAANVRRVFNLARQDTAGYEAYARKVRRFMASRPATAVSGGLLILVRAGRRSPATVA